MNNLRRKDDDTSPTIAEAGSLAVRTRLQLTPSHAGIGYKFRRLRNARRSHEVALMSAPSDLLE